MSAPSHPSWCDRDRCTARGSRGAHRSALVRVDQAVRIEASLYALASAPELPLVEIRCGERVLSGRNAYGLGRILVSLGKAAR
jgi:hypothetical protein